MEVSRTNTYIFFLNSLKLINCVTGAQLIKVAKKLQRILLIILTLPFLLMMELFVPKVVHLGALI